MELLEPDLLVLTSKLSYAKELFEPKLAIISPNVISVLLPSIGLGPTSTSTLANVSLASPLAILSRYVSETLVEGTSF